MRSLSTNRLTQWMAAGLGLAMAVSVVRGASVEDVMARLRAQNITGTTVITHGYQFTDTGGDSLMPLATAIRNRVGALTGGTVWLVDYDLLDDGASSFIDDGQSFLPAPGASGGTGHAVILYDWAAESNETTNGGWAEGAGDALFTLMAGSGIVNPRRAQSAPLHFIAHSFGSGVTSEAVERLASYRVPVKHLTFLDPHDFDQADVPVDEDQRIFQLGRPANYGATVWNNVQFAESYYQTRGNQSSIIGAGTDNPEGRPISGAANELMDTELPAGNPYPNFSAQSDHGYVWDSFYLSTVNGALRPGAFPAQGAVNYATTGWQLSPFSGASLAKPAANFYGAGQDHEHSETYLVDRATGTPNAAGLAGAGLSEGAVVNGRWDPVVTQANISNGQFEFTGSRTVLSDTVPSWTHHGGGGDGDVDVISGTGVLTLNNDDEIRIHNRLYVPFNAKTIQFDAKITDTSTDDRFRVHLGSEQIFDGQLTNAFASFVATDALIPAHLRGTVNTITMGVYNTDTGFFGDTDSEILIDNVRFGMLNPLLVEGPTTSGNQISFGSLVPQEARVLSDRVVLRNEGDMESLIGIADYEIFGGDAALFNIVPSPVTELSAFVHTALYDLIFLGAVEQRTYQTFLAFRTTAGDVSYVVRAFVVPEPSSLALLLIGGVAMLRRAGRSRFRRFGCDVTTRGEAEPRRHCVPRQSLGTS